MDILVVSEDPHFSIAVHDLIGGGEHRIVGCLGPSNSHCPLEERHACPLAGHSQVVLVDVPPSGSFGRPGHEIPAGAYAEKLQAMHPDAFVLLCGATPAAGASGEVDHVADRLTALATVQALLEARV